MRVTAVASIGAVLLALLCPLASGEDAAKAGKAPEAAAKTLEPAFVIPLKGTIDGGLLRSLERRTAAALERHAKLLIFEIDTWGGGLQPAIDISEHLGDLKGVKTVAFVPKKAISAGALVAVACNEIVMGPHSTIGDCQPIVPTQEGFKEAGEKVESPLRAQFRKFAKKNNYPELLLQAMVTRNLEIYRLVTDAGQRFITARELEAMTERERDEIRSKTLVTRVAGELLTLDQEQAVEYGLAKHVAQDVAEVLKLYGVKSAEAPKLETNWSEEMVRFLDSIAPILLGIGMLAIWLELKSPGFGVFGILGIACFATVFLAKYLVGLAEAPEILIFVVGFALVAAELFLFPGTAILGLLGVLTMVVGLVLSFQDFVVPELPYEADLLWSNLFKIGCSFVGALVGFVLIARFLPSVPVLNRVILTATESVELGFTVEKPEEKRLVGKSGTAVTTLRPSGRAEIDGQPVDVVAEGDFIERGQPIVVAEVKGNRVVVRPA